NPEMYLQVAERGANISVSSLAHNVVASVEGEVHAFESASTAGKFGMAGTLTGQALTLFGGGALLRVAAKAGELSAVAGGVSRVDAVAGRASAGGLFGRGTNAQ